MSDDKELKDQRIPIMMTSSEVQAIDDWAFKNRIRSRGEAIRRLCQVSLMLEDRIADITEARFSAIEKMTSLGNILGIENEQGSPDIRRARYAVLKATEALIQVLRKDTNTPASQPADNEQAFLDAVHAFAALDSSVQEIGHTMQLVRSPTEIEMLFKELEANTEVFDQLLGRKVRDSQIGKRKKSVK